MRLSNLADYAVITMCQAATHCGDGRVSAAELAAETGLAPIGWIHSIASAATVATQPEAGQLRLRPERDWKTYQDTALPLPFYALKKQKTTICTERPWSLETSFLARYRDPATLHKQNIEPPEIFSEGITIHRCDCRAWLESIAHPLPRFWFYDEAITASEYKTELKDYINGESPTTTATEATIEPVEPSPPPAPAPPDLPLSNDQIIAHRRTAALHWLTENPEADITAAADHLRGLDVTGVELFRVFVSVKRMKDPGRLLEQYDANNSKDKFKERKRLGNLICKKLPKAKK